MYRHRHRLTKRQRRFLDDRYFIHREAADFRPCGQRPGWLAITRSGAHQRYWGQYRYELEQKLLWIHDKELKENQHGHRRVGCNFSRVEAERTVR